MFPEGSLCYGSTSFACLLQNALGLFPWQTKSCEINVWGTGEAPLTGTLIDGGAETVAYHQAVMNISSLALSRASAMASK